MRLTVEFLGMSRRLAAAKEAVLDMEETASLRDVLHRLAGDYPALLGPVIDPVSHELVSAYMLNLDGRRAARNLDERPHDGQHLILMYVEAGG